MPGILKKLFDQANTFDNGKTWKNPAGKQAPAVTPAQQVQQVQNSPYISQARKNTITQDLTAKTPSFNFNQTFGKDLTKNTATMGKNIGKAFWETGDMAKNIVQGQGQEFTQSLDQSIIGGVGRFGQKIASAVASPYAAQKAKEQEDYARRVLGKAYAPYQGGAGIAEAEARRAGQGIIESNMNRAGLSMNDTTTGLVRKTVGSAAEAGLDTLTLGTGLKGASVLAKAPKTVQKIGAVAKPATIGGASGVAYTSQQDGASIKDYALSGVTSAVIGGTLPVATTGLVRGTKKVVQTTEQKTHNHLVENDPRYSALEQTKQRNLRDLQIAKQNGDTRLARSLDANAQDISRQQAAIRQQAMTQQPMKKGGIFKPLGQSGNTTPESPILGGIGKFSKTSAVDDKAIKQNLAKGFMEINPADQNAVRGVFKNSGYTEVDGFLVHPNVDTQWIKDLSPQTKNLMHENGIVYIDHIDNGAKGNGMALQKQLGNTQVKGIAVRTDKNIGSNLFTNKDSVVTHEIGHHQWRQLSPEEQAQWEQKAHASGSTYIQRLKDGHNHSGGSLGEEAFAEDLSHRLTGQYAGGAVGKDVRPKGAPIEKTPPKLYHGGTTINKDAIRNSELGYSVSTDKNVAKWFANTKSGGNINEHSISPNAKILNSKDIPQELKDNFTKLDKDKSILENLQDGPAMAKDAERKLVAYAKANGYDAIDMSGEPFVIKGKGVLDNEAELRILNPDILTETSTPATTRMEEMLIEAVNSSPSLTGRIAAKRLLDKRGIDWKSGAPIEKTAQTAANPIVKEYADMLRQAESGLKAGLQKVDDGTYAGTYTRVSEHTPFFRDFYAKNGKKPTIADWQKEAQRQLDSGKAHPEYQKLYQDSQNPEIASLLQQADQGQLGKQPLGETIQLDNPGKQQKPNTATSKATKNQAQALEVQKTPQTQPNLAQATDMAGGSTIGKEKLPQQKEQVTGTAQTSQSSGNTYNNSKQQRGFKVNISKDTETPLSVYKDIPGYNVKPNAKTIGSAAKRVSKDPEGTYNRLLENGIQKTEDSADALVLLRNLVENDELDKAGKLAQATAKAGTDFGQAVQIFSAFRKTTPDGALRDAWNIVNAYNTKNPKKAPIRITKEQSQKIVDLATDLQKTEYGTREWAVKAALLEREKGLLTPNTFLSKVSTVQTMAQLLNPKTAIRNILGNGVLDLAEDLVRLPATGIDKALKGLGFIDQRNMVVPSMKTNWANKLLGFKQGVEDVNLGIRTQGATGNYDISKEVFKPGSLGNKLEKLLGYELSSMDKAFYTGRYQSSLENMMKAQKVKVPTPEMKATAEAEALYATFQNNSNLSIGLQKAKNAMNAGKEWGLGDFILKYPKTPGNIVNVGLDYSPVGFIKGLKSLHDGIKLKNIQDIRGGELLISRGLVGTGLIAGGAFLAKQGIISGKQDGDYDKSAADRDLGKGPFTFNITALGRLLKGEDTKPRPGDVTANYDWLQPNAIQLSMGANMIINSDSATQQINTNLESLGAGVDTITEQPVFRGVKEFVGDLNTQQGGGLGKATQGVATNAMSSFVPSIVNQVGQQFDNTKRSTYGQTPFEEATNKVKGRIPGARNTLYPSLNTLGKEQSQYDVGGNNPFNVFINPAFLNRVKDEPALKEADTLNQRTGETSQYPRSLTGKQTIDGVKTKLTAQQLYDLKKNVGQTTDEVFRGFINSPAFQAKSDEEKVKLLSGALTDVNAAGRAELAAKNELGQYAPNFTGKATKLSTGAKQILSNGALDYVNGKLTDKKQTAKTATKTTKKKTRRTSSGGSKAKKSYTFSDIVKKSATTQGSLRKILESAKL